MELYWGKHTCAIGIHILLEEAGADYRLREIDVQGGENRRAPFIDLNPKGKVPTLVRDDGSVLTEYGAIAGWLADAHPNAGLLPAEEDGRVRMWEALNYTVGHLHAEAFQRIFFPDRFASAAKDDPAVKAQVRAQGREMAEEAFAILARGLGGEEWVAGTRFSLGDTALFYAARWAGQAKVALPDAVAAHLQRMKARPKVAGVMAVWGEA